MCGRDEGKLKILLITVAGMSQRFSESIGRPCLKCIYYKNNIKESLLYQMMHKEPEFDRYVIVGGYKFDKLKETLDKYFTEFSDRIILVENDKYKEYGSGYSLYLGLEAVKELDFEELIFAEGDLYVDSESFLKVCKIPNNVITCNGDDILASKAVAFYYDAQYGIHYIYDTGHSALEIREPFLGIFNSGQIWKFADRRLLIDAASRVGEKEWQGTNLNLIQEYFGALDRKEYEIVRFKDWVNCNTISDFDKMCELKSF